MKTLLGLGLFLTLSASALTVPDHTEVCASTEAKRLMGKNGSCQMLITPLEKSDYYGKCSGDLGPLRCKVSILNVNDYSGVNILCGDAAAPVLAQEYQSEFLSYSVSALIKNNSGDYVTINIPNEYHVMSSPVLDVQVIKNKANLEGKMSVKLQGEHVQLENVVCN